MNAQAPDLQARLREKFQLALGSDIAALLDEPEVCEVAINASGRIFVERAGAFKVDIGLRMSAPQRLALIRAAAELAGRGPELAHWPLYELRLPPAGWRFSAVVPPNTPAPLIVIRNPPRIVYSLESYVTSGRMIDAQRAAIVAAVRAPHNVLVVGPTGSGKTTLGNAVLRQLEEECPEDRIAIIEDTPELQCRAENLVALEARGGVTMEHLLQMSLRLTPDRIVFGEVRSAVARDLVDAWHTHSGGVCTLHADSARVGLTRLEQMCRGHGSEASVRSEIAHAVKLIVFIAQRPGRGPNGERFTFRRVEEVLRVHGLNKQGEYECERVG